MYWEKFPKKGNSPIFIGKITHSVLGKLPGAELQLARHSLGTHDIHGLT